MIIGVIPARFASTRLPGKPLAMINGKTMIERVVLQALQAKLLDKVAVATDHPDIVAAIAHLPVTTWLTDPDCPNGTLRVAQALKQSAIIPEYVINIQGDEPFLNPAYIDVLASTLTAHTASIATLIAPVAANEALNPSVVKCVIGVNGNALYFSRSLIPFVRDPNLIYNPSQTFFKHIGMYGFDYQVFNELIQLPETQLEKLEQLEQLRWLSHGYPITTAQVAEAAMAIDTQEDLSLAQEYAIKYQL